MEYALVIGIDHYTNKPLEGAVADAESFATWLLENELISDPKNNLQLLNSTTTNSRVLQDEIDLILHNFIQDAQEKHEENNRIYFYFSGHGIGNTFHNTALCLRRWPTLINHCISSLHYKDALINSGAFSEILIFLDCCREHDTTIKGSTPLLDYDLVIDNKIPKILVCNSTIYGKYSYEVSNASNKKRGAFTSFLIESLKGDADIDNVGMITAANLKKHVENNFIGYAQKLGKIQQADLSVEGDISDLVICKVSNHVQKYNCEILFQRNSNITLIGKDTKPLKTADVLVGDKWQLTLETGIYVLQDNYNPNDQKVLINYSPNTISHETF